jgi:hypothetical protein
VRPGRPQGEVLGRIHGGALSLMRSVVTSLMRGVVLSWIRVVRLAWRGRPPLAGDGMRAPVAIPGWTRAVIRGSTHVLTTAPLRRATPARIRGGTPVAVLLERTRAVVPGQPGGAILAAGGTRVGARMAVVWARVAAVVASTRAVIRGLTRAVSPAPIRGAMPGWTRAGTLAMAGEVSRAAVPAVVPDRLCRVMPGWTRAGTPAVAGGRIPGLARVAIPGWGETPGWTPVGRQTGSGPGRTPAVPLARKPGSALVPMPGWGPGRTPGSGRGRGPTVRPALARILGRPILGWPILGWRIRGPGPAPTADRQARSLAPVRLSSPLRNEVPGALVRRGARTAERPR